MKFHENSCNPLTNLAAILRQVLVIDPSSNSLMPRSNFTVQVWGMDADTRWLNFECSGLWQWTPTPQTWTLLAAVPLKNRQLLKSRLFLDSQDLFAQWYHSTTGNFVCRFRTYCGMTQHHSPMNLWLFSPQWEMIISEPWLIGIHFRILQMDRWKRWFGGDRER